MKNVESSFKTKDKLELYYQIWTPTDYKGTLIITHGHGEHSDWYFRLSNFLMPKQWRIIAWDLRGYGRSEGKRGYAPTFDHYCHDLIHFLSHLKNSKQLSSKYVLLGHSMGGLINLKSQLLFDDINAQAYCYSSPLLGISVPVSRLKETLAQIGNKYFPKLTLNSQININNLTRDRKIINSYIQDPLRTYFMSPGVFLGIKDSIECIFQQLEKINSPLLIQYAQKDQIVNPDATKKLIDLLSHHELKSIAYPHSYHEIFNDLNRDEVFNDLYQFLKRFEL